MPDKHVILTANNAPPLGILTAKLIFLYVDVQGLPILPSLGCHFYRYIDFMSQEYRI